jgi:iron complex transport system substrate-binding protein
MRLRRAAIAPLLFLYTALLAQITVVDDIHRTVRLSRPAERVVSLAPSLTESLFAIGAGDRVCGVTDYCDFPPAARRKPRVGGMVNPNLEAVIGLRPDLIVLSMEGNVRADFDRLSSLGVPVYVSNPRSLAGIYRSLEALGTLTGSERASRALVDSLARRERALRDSAAGKAPVGVLLIVSLEPLMCAGKGTFIDELITEAGGRNIARQAPGSYPVYSREQVIRDDPDVIIVTSDALPAHASLAELYPAWRSVSALKRGRVVSIDPDIVSRPGPRALDALDSLFHILHPPP